MLAIIISTFFLIKNKLIIHPKETKKGSVCIEPIGRKDNELQDGAGKFYGGGQCKFFFFFCY
jgi:hypothetical protein